MTDLRCCRRIKPSHPCTVELMARELGIVSDFQAAEMLMKEENLT
jgi:hypothetical protein